MGNHEFDKGFDDLTNGVVGNPPNAKWKYLGANVYVKGTTTPALPEYQVFTVNGVKIGVIGAVTEETPAFVSPGGITQVEFGDPVAAVNRVAGQFTDGDASNGEADVLVAEYHEGATEGTAPVPGAAGKTRPVLQTGDYGENVGQVVLTFDKTAKAVVSYTTQNVHRITAPDDATLIATYPRIAQVNTITQAALARAAVIGNQPVGKVTADITAAYLGANRDDRPSSVTWSPTRCGTSCPPPTVAALRSVW